jgi:hypothetical protein
MQFLFTEHFISDGKVSDCVFQNLLYLIDKYRIIHYGFTLVSHTHYILTADSLPSNPLSLSPNPIPLYSPRKEQTT